MNLLIIFTDQRHHRALGRLDPLYRTPHLDVLADEGGAVYPYVQQQSPVRALPGGGMMTGLLTSLAG